MSDDDETRPLGSSVDVGWSNGKPRVVGDDVKSFMAQSGSRVTETKISGRMPRPRSKNPPKPAVTVNYGNVPRNQMDNIDVEEVSACVHFLFFCIIAIDLRCSLFPGAIGRSGPAECRSHEAVRIP